MRSTAPTKAIRQISKRIYKLLVAKRPTSVNGSTTGSLIGLLIYFSWKEGLVLQYVRCFVLQCGFELKYDIGGVILSKTWNFNQYFFCYNPEIVGYMEKLRFGST